MINVIADVRTVELISKDNNDNYGITTMKNGRKKITFKVAVNTDTQEIKLILNAFDNLAEILEKLATEKKEDGKLVSRYINVLGNLDIFTNTSKQENINITAYGISFLDNPDEDEYLEDEYFLDEH